MGSANIGNLNVQLNLEIGRLQAQIDSANGKIKSLTRKMENDFSKAAKNVNKALSTVGLGLSAGAVINFGKSVLDLGGKITDLSNQAGIGTDAFQTFANVASQSGVSAEQVAQSFVAMRKNIEEAAQGSKAQSEALASLNLSADRLQSIAPERQFEEIARAIQASADKNKAFNASLEILGAKTAPKLTEVLQRLGVEGFDKLSKEVENLNLSKDQLKVLDDAGDKLGRIWDSLKVMSGQAFVVAVNFAVGDGTNEATAARMKELSRVGGLGLTESDPMWQQIMEQNRVERQRINPLAGANVPFNDSATAINSATIKAEQAAEAAAQMAEFQAQYDQLIKGGGLAGIQEGSDATGKQLLQDIEARNQLFEDGRKVLEANLSPLEAYNAEISRLVDLQNAGAISARTYDRATVAAGEAYQKATSGAKEYSEELDDLGTKATALDRELTGVWENVADRAAQSFADILIDGESTFNELPRIVARALAEIAFKMAVINPLINGLFGLSGTGALPAFYGAGAAPAHAGGGRPNVGEATWIGERGKELWVPDEPGMIVPNHRLGEIGGGGGTVINADLRGASVEAVMRLEQYVRSIDGTLEKRAIGAVANERKRGGGMGRGLGS